MSQPQEEVLVTATVSLTEKHIQSLDDFHSYIMFLEDVYFSVEHQKREEFDKACTTLPSVIPLHFLSLEQVETADEQLQRLFSTFEKTCQEELTMFHEEGEDLKQQMTHIIDVLQEKWELAERRRQDDFVEMSLACQRELAAVIAELRSGVLAHFHDTRMSAVLEEALNAKIGELQTLQGKLEELIELRQGDFSKHQSLLQAEREKHRQRFLALQQDTTRAIDELTEDKEEQQRLHLREMRELQLQHTFQVKALEKRMCEEREEHTARQKRVAEELEHYRIVVKSLDEERTKLMQAISELKIQIEEWRRRYNERDSQAKLEMIELQTLSETLQVEKAQVFCKQLVETVRRGASSAALTTLPISPALSPKCSSSLHSVHSRVQRTSPLNGGNTSSIISGEDVMPRHDFVVAKRSFVSSTENEKSTALPFSKLCKGNDNPFGDLALYKPTQSYVKLMNLSEQLKRHIEFS